MSDVAEPATKPEWTGWNPADATDEIRAIARNKGLAVSYQLRARERLAERGLIVSDLLYALKNGFV